MEVTMPETLLTPTGIKLYGRVVTDIFTWQAAKAKAIAAGATAAKWDQNAPPPGYPGLGKNTFLQFQLQNPDAILARIYGFSYQGNFYDLPRPAIFLAHGPGAPVDLGDKWRTTMEISGVAARDWEFSQSDTDSGGNKVVDLRMWEYEKGDFSMRLDIESGPFEQILLAACLRGGSPFASGSDLRTSGSDLRTSGSDLRMSGSDLRISGSDLRRR